MVMKVKGIPSSFQIIPHGLGDQFIQYHGDEVGSVIREQVGPTQYLRQGVFLGIHNIHK